MVVVTILLWSWCACCKKICYLKEWVWVCPMIHYEFHSQLVLSNLDPQKNGGRGHIASSECLWGLFKKNIQHYRLFNRIVEEIYKNNRVSNWSGAQELQWGSGQKSIQVKYDILIFMIENLCQMVTYESRYVVILSTVQFKLSQERVYLVNFFGEIQGLNLLEVFEGASIMMLVSVFVILIFINMPWSGRD